MPLNSIQSNTCGATGSIINCPMSVPKTSGTSMNAPVRRSVVCAAVPVSLPPSGSSLRLLSSELYYAKLSKFGGITHVAVLICYALAQTANGQSAPGARQRSEPEAVALYVGILRELEQLRGISRRPDAQN